MRKQPLRNSRYFVFVEGIFLEGRCYTYRTITTRHGGSAQTMASSSTLFAVRSETSLPGDRSGPDPGDQEPSANMAAEQNSTIRTRTKDSYCFAQWNVRFYGQHGHRTPI